MSIFRKKKNDNSAVFSDVTEGLRSIYKEHLISIERDFLFNDIQSPVLEDPDFDAKPMVMLVGQYSTGKTSFIKFLIERDFPGMLIGPEPTTDKFQIISYGKDDGKIPGHVMAVDKSKPFRKLQDFGGTFLSRFEGSETDSEVLKSLNIVDTPGILAGEKQSISRGYDFTGVLKWFAERADRIILLFDAHKLDISDEFKTAIEAIKKQEDKIRIILNKGDMLTHQQLMRVYGALMWSLSKILKTPEVARVYVGSFWNNPLLYDANRDLFEAEQNDLMQDLQSLPRFAAVRKLNDLIKRTRALSVHVRIISYLKQQMPTIGKASKKKELIKNLAQHFQIIQSNTGLPTADFPDADMFVEGLQNLDFNKFPVASSTVLERLEKVLTVELTRVMALLPHLEDVRSGGVSGGIFTKRHMPVGQGIMGGSGEKGWIVTRFKAKYDEIFNNLEQTNGKISGSVARKEMIKSKLPTSELGKIWRLADVDRDGFLDIDEFALAMYLTRLKIEGHEMPADLPAHLLPPSKRPEVNGTNGTLHEEKE